jgi:hypothetical protein
MSDDRLACVIAAEHVGVISFSDAQSAAQVTSVPTLRMTLRV